MGSLFLCELCLNKIIAKSITLCHNEIKIGGLYGYGLYLVKKWPERPNRPGFENDDFIFRVFGGEQFFSAAFKRRNVTWMYRLLQKYRAESAVTRRM